MSQTTKRRRSSSSSNVDEVEDLRRKLKIRRDGVINISEFALDLEKLRDTNSRCLRHPAGKVFIGARRRAVNVLALVHVEEEGAIRRGPEVDDVALPDAIACRSAHCAYP